MTDQPNLSELMTACACGYDGQECGVQSENEPRWCDASHEGRAALLGIYGELSVIEYQPGWSFRWSCANGLLFLHVVPGGVKTLCSRTGDRRPVPHFMYIIDDVRRADLTNWLRKELEEMDAHERDEWLVVDGERPFDPHVGEEQ